MKRLRIWISRFNLMQQFLTIGFLMIALFLIFSVTFLNRSVNSFINEQMIHYLHRSQDEFLLYRGVEHLEDVNACHIIWNEESGSWQGRIDADKIEILREIPLSNKEETTDGIIEKAGLKTIYTVRHIAAEKISVVSILRDSYRRDYEKALFDSVINAAMMLIFALFFMIVIWIFSLLRPLSQIKNYIESIREGRDGELKMTRGDEIGEVAEALVDMQTELRQQKQIREEMVQNISHDLKTPIATIKSYSESIKDGVYPYDTLEKSVDVIIEHADRLEKKVYSLITYNKMGYLMDNGDSDKQANMYEIIQKAIVAVQVLRNDIRIETDLQEVFFRGETEPWQIVVENLLDNALRYAKNVVRICLSEEELSVYNDGSNMTQERIDKLFKPYEKGSGGNFGLGLSIVKRVCDTYHYGVIGENTNDGVIFKVYATRKKR